MALHRGELRESATEKGSRGQALWAALLALTLLLSPLFYDLWALFGGG